MEFIDLHRQYERYEASIQQRLAQVWAHKRFILGPEVEELEERLAAFCGRRFALTVASGTDALLLPLLAMELQPDEAVLLPSFTFFATAEVVNLAGGTPVFVDAAQDYNISLATLEAAYQRVQAEGKLKPRALITVDLFGRLCAYEQILPWAQERGLFVLEDAAQAFGAAQGARRACSFGAAAATSFFPAKPLGCYGDGGALFTDDALAYERYRSLRVHGQGSRRYEHERIGLNARLDTVQAAILLAKLDFFPAELETRAQLAAAYTARLEGHFALPAALDATESSAWAQYCLLAASSAERDFLQAELKTAGIPTMIYYPTPLHLQAVYRQASLEPASGQQPLGLQTELTPTNLAQQAQRTRACPTTLPRAELLAERIFALPFHPYLEPQEVDYVCAQLLRAKAAWQHRQTLPECQCPR